MRVRAANTLFQENLGWTGAIYRATTGEKTIYQRHVSQVLEHDPHVVMDDGADLIAAIHQRNERGSVFAGLEETTIGVTRTRVLAAEGLLRFPVIAVNDTPTKRMFDNRYGTGQNTVDGLLRSAHILLAGATAVVAGYGWVGRGIALRLRGMGARVIVCEIDATRALEATMEGLQVLPMTEAAPLGDLFITATAEYVLSCHAPRSRARHL